MKSWIRIDKAISIRFSLLRNFIFLILISSLTVLILMTIRVKSTEEELSEKLINQGWYKLPRNWKAFFSRCVAGKTEPTEIYEILGQTGAVSEKVRAVGRRYEAAWERYCLSNFHQAIRIFKQFGPDIAVHLLRERCKEYVTSPPGPDWDGIQKCS